MARDMISVYCRKCETTYLAAADSIDSTHRTAEGLVGYVLCGAGHLVIHQFAEAYPKPKPPVSVLALRARLAAADTAAGNY